MQAVQALGAGNLDSAQQAIEAALARDPRNFDALHIGGVVAWQQGDEQLGEQRLSAAMALRPADPEPHFNLGSALLKAGSYARARDAFDEAIKRNSDHVQAWNNLGTALAHAGDHQAALKAYRTAFEKNPQHVGAMHNAANLLLQEGDPAQARVLYERALGFDPGHAGALLGLAQCLLDLEQNKAAVEIAGRAAQAHDDARLWNVLGLALARCEQFDLASDAFNKALALEPDFADVHNNLASTYVVTEQAALAENHFKKALELNPAHAEAWGNLAAFYELANRLDEARQAAESGLAVGADESMLRMTLAKCARRTGDPAQALAELQIIAQMDRDLPIKATKELYFELGATYDKLGDYGQAYAAFTQANQLAGEWWYSGDPEQDSFVPALDRLSAHIQSAAGAGAGASPGPEKPPAFLLGFARSGTTLMDTILGAHSGIEVLEEAPTLSRVIRQLGADNIDYPEQLNHLGNRELTTLRQTYFDSAAAAGATLDGRLLIDKNPLSTAHIPLITQLFPEARIILAIRHPYDVVLSCFMQDFAMNPFMTHFLDLEGAAKVYVKVMRLWQQYAKHLQFNWHRIRYEDLVADQVGQTDALFRFLGLDPEQAGDYQAHAQDRGLINTPSYHQVSQPIYRHARYRWKHYESQLAPVRAILKPFASYFDYAEI